MKNKQIILVAVIAIIAIGFYMLSQEPETGIDTSNDNVETRVLNLNLGSEPPSLHPGLASDTTSGSVLRQIFEGLATLDSNSNIILGSAESYTISDDGLVYTFRIRDNASWSNGDTLRAQDFEYAWKWVLTPQNNANYSYQLYPIKNAQAFFEGNATEDELGIRSIDDKTLEITLEAPISYFMELLSFYTYFPINANVTSANPSWAADSGPNYVSNGPFQLVSWSHNNKIELEKNENYWNADQVNLNQISMLMVNDENTNLQMFRTNEIDWAGSPLNPTLPSEAIPSLKESNELITHTIAGTYWVIFNTEKPPFDNENLRKALAYSMNRNTIIENILQAGQIPAMANVPPTIFPENTQGYFSDNNLDEAKRYLALALEELGLESVDQLPTIEYAFNTNESHRKIAQALQDIWRSQLGLNVTLENFEWKVYIDRVRSGDHVIGRMGWIGDFNDAINFLELYEDKEGGNNFAKWENQEFQDLLESSRTEVDADRRKEILKQAEMIMMEEMPVAPLYFYTYSWIKSPDLQGVIVGPLGQFILREAYFQ